MSRFWDAIEKLGTLTRLLLTLLGLGIALTAIGAIAMFTSLLSGEADVPAWVILFVVAVFIFNTMNIALCWRDKNRLENDNIRLRKRSGSSVPEHSRLYEQICSLIEDLSEEIKQDRLMWPAPWNLAQRYITFRDELAPLIPERDIGQYPVPVLNPNSGRDKTAGNMKIGDLRSSLRQMKIELEHLD